MRRPLVVLPLLLLLPPLSACETYLEAPISAPAEEAPENSAPFADGTLLGPDGPFEARYYLDADGFAVAGGDMLFRHDDRPRAASSNNPSRRWPGGVIPYKNNSQNEHIDSGLAWWNGLTATTGVSFVPYTDEENYVVFTAKEGCASNVGMLGGEQVINTASCPHALAFAHELGHTVGFIHEHQRPDRAQFISIDKDNVRDNVNFEHTFGVISSAKTLTEYDYASIMHYPLGLGAKDKSKPVITTLKDTGGAAIGQGTQLSAGDISAATAMYGPATTGQGDGTDTIPGEAETSCANLCADFDVSEGACKEFDTGSFECKDGCLEQVAACPATEEDSCEYSCAANDMGEWDCRVFGTDSYQCLAGCLVKITSCPGGGTGNTDNTDTTGDTGTGGAECTYLCEDNNLTEWECKDFTTGSYQCLGGCMMQVASCGGSTDTGTDTGGAECTYLCDDNGLAEWECREFTTGFYQCLGGCMMSVASCT
jgi:hypothetical protein